jgi:uncharacterized membrane protein
MPFCSQCGKQVGAADRFCGSCGATQPASNAFQDTASRIAGDALAGVPPRTASILCYVPWVGWIPAVMLLASEKFRQNLTVRFHAFQGLYLFVAWLLNHFVIRNIFWPALHIQIADLIDLALLIMQIFMIVKAAHEQKYSLPVFGELAARSVAEG